MLTITHKRTLVAIQSILWVLWPSTIWATTITLGSTVSEVPMLAWLVVFVLSTVTSLLALLNRLKIETPPRLGLFVASHVLGSWVAGGVIFGGAEAFDLNDFLEVGAIVLGSYGGSKLLDRLADAFINRLANQVEKADAAKTDPQAK